MDRCGEAGLRERRGCGIDPPVFRKMRSEPWLPPHIGNKHLSRSVTIVVNMLSRAGIVAAFAVVMMAPWWAQAEDFDWKYGGVRVGRLKVPAGFKVENYDYREGIVTTLLYQDGSRITLQSGVSAWNKKYSVGRTSALCASRQLRSLVTGMGSYG